MYHRNCVYCRKWVFYKDPFYYTACGPFCTFCFYQRHCKHDCWVCAELNNIDHEPEKKTKKRVRNMSSASDSSNGPKGLLAAS